jgi:hypothetical protein
LDHDASPQPVDACAAATGKRLQSLAPKRGAQALLPSPPSGLGHGDRRPATARLPVPADPNRYHIEVVAKLDGGKERRSYISIQVFGDASLEIRVHGDHVLASEKKMHRKLAAEIDELTEALLATGQAVR